MFFNHTKREVTAKIVYYGPGLSGKTTNLQYIFSTTNPTTRGELVSIETDIERTLFFDLLPVNVGPINGYQAKFQLYTVPGQVFYNSTRKLVLRGVDGLVFVADSQQLMEQANMESFKNLKNNLSELNQDFGNLPIVFQYNKRDLQNLISIKKLRKNLNKQKRPDFEAIALSGKGVIDTLREISSLTLIKIKETIDQSQPEEKEFIQIDFDTNLEKEIIKKEELPVKKVPVDSYQELDNKIPAQETEPITTESDPQKEKSLSLLESLEDKSRLTVIKKLSLKDDKISIDIKNNKSKIIKTIDLDVNQDIKKINLILDVED